MDGFAEAADPPVSGVSVGSWNISFLDRSSAIRYSSSSRSSPVPLDWSYTSASDGTTSCFIFLEVIEPGLAAIFASGN